MSHFVNVRSGQACPKDALRAPDEGNSVVCHWADREQGTFGRGDVDHYISGLQAWFPWGGDEHDSQSLRGFQVMVKRDQYRYAWIRVAKVQRERHRFQPFQIGSGMSPCVINNRLGKVKISNMQGWTCYGGTENVHSQYEVQSGLVLCLMTKTPAANMVYCYSGQQMPPGAIKANMCKQGSYVCHWSGAEQGIFGRASVGQYQSGMQAWFPHGGKEHDSNSIGAFEVLCMNYEFDYNWESIDRLLKGDSQYEVFEINGYCPAVVNGLLGKANLKRGMAWTSWGGNEDHFTGQAFRSAYALCVKMKSD